jgi:hypothetical protein
VTVDASVTDLPRVGLRFDLPAGFEELAWYGRGPAESYPDRTAGYPVGRYRSTVTDQYVPYVLPQEHGGHADTRWVVLGRGEVRDPDSGSKAGAEGGPASAARRVLLPSLPPRAGPSSSPRSTLLRRTSTLSPTRGRSSRAPRRS